MKKLPAVLVGSFLKTLAAASIDRTLAGDYLKWLRFYLDFCLKYHHPPAIPTVYSLFYRNPDGS
jgi:hypothetical protein